MDNLAEVELLKAAQAGDQDAFETLWREFEPPLLRFVGRLIGAGQEAEDIVQETLMALYLHLDQIDPPEKLRPYVFRIARNRCYDLLRRDGRFEQIDMPDDEAPVSVRVSFAGESSVPPDDAVHWLLLHLEVKEAMDRLPELQRQALTLYAEEEMSYAEIADIMGVTLGTIKSRIFHAKQTLRRLLRRETLAAIDSDETPEPEIETQEA